MGRLNILKVAVLALCCHTVAFAGQPNVEQCIVEAAHYRGQDPKLLKAIAVQESGMNPNAVNRNNKNGSVDIGLFQINSSWLAKLKSQGITETQLYDGCISAYVAAWILANEINTHGSTWRAVGAYNSPTESKRKIYASRIQTLYTSLSNGQKP